MYGFLQTSGAILLLLLSTPIHGSIWQNNVNFSACYQDFVSKIPQSCNDDRQVCVNNTFGEIIHPGHVYITYDTCLRECGTGFGFWDIKDVLLRISLWVTPAIVLIAHYHFPPLGAWNSICVVVHVLADPIDTLWCLLTRIAIRHDLLNRAAKWELESAGAIATIWATYDELGFQDPSEDFRTALAALRRNHGFGEDFLKVDENRRPDRAITSRSLDSTLTAKGRIKAFFSSAQSQQIYLDRVHRAILNLQTDERRMLYHIELAAQRLVFNRQESLLTTWISIFGLLSALMGAFVRTWTERLNNQTAHTIATVTLLLVIVPIVKLSGNLGAFTSSTAPIDIIETLRKDLENEFSTEVAALFPPLRKLLDLSLNQPNRARCGPIPMQQDESIPLTHLPSQRFPPPRAMLLLSWPPVAPYAGLNSSYRPFKTLSDSSCKSQTPRWLPRFLTPVHRHRKSSLLLFISALWILVFCYVPALVISFLTPLRGFACRSLAWTVIATCWIVSLATSLLLSLLQSSRFWNLSLKCVPDTFRRRVSLSSPLTLSSQKAWKITCLRDILVSLFIALIVVAQQIGLYNSCYCRSGELSRVNPSYVNLNPFTDKQFIDGWKMWVPTPGAAFLVSLAGILIIERVVFVDSGQLFSKGREGRENMLVWVGCLETRINQ
ncbi:hypothetical protein QBC42DRAFT_326846 [Cladorrhinum samala]|uniref:Uncharacterized protein n=1 Tax=Cladorrhinum samala TaxID=585594 RepID=A0AAV9HT17_9PEZI|nr:hypothetical protein QBC42DRAFT_326846 [Cladorrhinum samala]